LVVAARAHRVPRLIQRVDEARAARAQVVGGRVGNAQSMLNDAGRGRHRIVARRGGDDEQIDVLWAYASVGERLFGGLDGPVRGSFPFGGDAALLDSRPRGDPLVGRIHHFLQIDVGQSAVGDGVAD